MTIQEARREGISRLSTIYPAGEAAAIIDWVIEYISGAKTNERLTNPRKELQPRQLEQLQQFLDRLAMGEPVQYVLEESWFCGLRFKVNRNVLIPRPETEELVEWVIANCKFPLGELKILDIGTGSGCIAISLKRRLGKAEVWACDLSTGALALARENARNLGVDVHFEELDFLSSTQRSTLPAFDIIISNPPYIPETDKAAMHNNVVLHEPHMALFVPDNDPLLFYKAIARFGQEHLRPQGQIFLEIHEGLGADVLDCFGKDGYYTELKQDMQGKDRMVKAGMA